MSPLPGVQTTSQGQAGPGLAADAARARHPDLDAALRTAGHRHPRALPRLTKRQKMAGGGAGEGFALASVIALAPPAKPATSSPSTSPARNSAPALPPLTSPPRTPRSPPAPTRVPNRPPRH